MQKKNLFGLALIVCVVLSFALVGCDTGTGGGGGNPQTVTYTGTNGSETYTLEITENTNRAAYTPKSWDNFRLIEVISTSTMWGTLEISGNSQTLILHPDSGGTITVTTSGNGIINISGNGYWSDGTVFTSPGALAPGDNNGGGGFTVGWPSAATLTQFGLAGLTAPAGATNTEHYVSAGRGLIINFKGGVAAHDTHVISGFTTNGWTYKMDTEGGDFSYWEGTSWSDATGCYYVLRKGDDGGNYGRSTATGDCSISVVKNYY